ncbi:hypothetical protein MKX03_001823 [Papaver bracteatum]|nr:hypothetical protein MKX03_001823 [Papaver bracteatum]
MQDNIFPGSLENHARVWLSAQHMIIIFVFSSRDFTQLPTFGAVISSQRFPTFQNQIEIKEDAASGSSISRASSMEYTDDDDEEVSSIMETEDDDEDYPYDCRDSDIEVQGRIVEVPETTDERFLAYRATFKKFKDMQPELQEWINFSLQTGLELSMEHGCLGLIVGCNVPKSVHFLDSYFQTAGACSLGADSSGHVKKNGICKDCSKRFVLVKDAVDTPFPHLP